MKLLRRPISASDRIPDGFCVISLEFLSLSSRRSSLRDIKHSVYINQEHLKTITHAKFGVQTEFT